MCTVKSVWMIGWVRATEDGRSAKVAFGLPFIITSTEFCDAVLFAPFLGTTKCGFGKHRISLLRVENGVEDSGRTELGKEHGGTDARQRAAGTRAIGRHAGYTRCDRLRYDAGATTAAI